jgi:hypothetical protein
VPNTAVALTDEAVTNNVPDPTPTDVDAPNFVSAETTVDGDVVILNFDETLDSTSTPVPVDFVVTADTTRISVTEVEISGDTVRLTLASEIQFGEPVLVSYAPGANPIQDSVPNTAVALTDEAVTNNVPDPTPPNSAPSFATATATATAERGTAADVFTPTPATDTDVSDTLTYSLASPVTGFTIRSTDGVVRMEADVAAGEYVLDIEVTDDGGLTDSLRVTITVTAPPAIASAAITGTPTVGQVLTAGSTGVTGTPAPTLTYQWKADGTNIAGATSSTFTLTSAQLGAVITVVVTATNGVGSAASAISSATTAVAAAPSTSGETVVAPPVQAPAPIPVAAPQITRSKTFAANSAKLNKDLRVSIRKALASNPNAKSAVCRGFVASGTATAADRKLARDRSTAVCNLITKLNPDLDVEVKKVVVASSSQQLRKVRIVLR